MNINTDQLRRYIREKQEEGYANGTIRRHLAALKQTFNMVVEADRASRLPHFPH